MNDRYRFRGKGVASGIWYYGWLVDNFIFTDFHTRYEIDPETVGQCTSLPDKQGKLIFQGDYVLTDEAGWRGEVVWNEKAAMFGVEDNKGGFSYQCNWNKFQIIGNRFDNPDLLKEGE